MANPEHPVYETLRQLDAYFTYQMSRESYGDNEEEITDEESTFIAGEMKRRGIV